MKPESLVAALFFDGAAHAVTDTVFRYSTPKTGYLSIPPAAFVSQLGNAIYSNAGGGIFDHGYFTAPVNLPHGAKITAFAF